MKVHILTDEEGIGQVLEEHVSGFGYGCKFSRRIEEFSGARKKGERYYLVVDYLLAEGDIRSFLKGLLYADPPRGLVVMSALPGFEEFLEEVAIQYTDNDIPFLFLEKPFELKEFTEILGRLGKGFYGRLGGCLRWPKYNYKHRGNLGAILKAARENLGLSAADVALAASKKGMWFKEDRILEIEKDKSGSEVSCEEWYFLSHLLFESADSVSVGFESWSHLRRVRSALKEKKYPFPKNFVLRRQLVELERREEIERKYHNVTNYGMLNEPRPRNLN